MRDGGSAFRENLEKARADFQQAIQLDPQLASAYSNRARISLALYERYREKSYLEDAKPDALGAVEHGTPTADMYMMAARVLAKLKEPDHDKIVELLQRAIAEGIVPERITGGSEFAFLKDNPGFQKLRDMKPGKPHSGNSSNLVIPPIDPKMLIYSPTSEKK
jgi:hypothetical protein